MVGNDTVPSVSDVKTFRIRVFGDLKAHGRKAQFYTQNKTSIARWCALRSLFTPSPTTPDGRRHCSSQNAGVQIRDRRFSRPLLLCSMPLTAAEPAPVPTPAMIRQRRAR